MEIYNHVYKGDSNIKRTTGSRYATFFISFLVVYYNKSSSYVVEETHYYYTHIHQFAFSLLPRAFHKNAPFPSLWFDSIIQCYFNTRRGTKKDT